MNLKYSMVATAIAIALASPVMPAHAQSAPIITQASSAGTIIGQVKEAASGVYLQGARVSVDGKQVVTERDGSFRLSGLAPGRYSVTVEFLGYQPRQFDVEVDATSGVRVELSLHSNTASAEAVAMDKVEVRGIRDAQALALNQQRNTINYTNVVSADLLGRFPDNN
ncbi:MAG: carboxypeptidase regulatory-like domain-containing protein, partial [Pseudoxanthomonas sp.]|nr:carboxypeptidase regulatory-like domain-containing protein [Pseudoxanthomonas sp.]